VHFVRCCRIAHYVDTPEELLRAATLLVEHGGKIEWGLGKNSTSGATFIYLFLYGSEVVEVAKTTSLA